MESDYDKKGVIRFHNLPMHYSLYGRFNYKIYSTSNGREIKVVDKHLNIESETIVKYVRAPFSQANVLNESLAQKYIDELNKNENTYLEAINEFCDI